MAIRSLRGKRETTAGLLPTQPTRQLQGSKLGWSWGVFIIKEKTKTEEQDSIGFFRRKGTVCWGKRTLGPRMTSVLTPGLSLVPLRAKWKETLKQTGNSVS